MMRRFVFVLLAALFAGLLGSVSAADDLDRQLYEAAKGRSQAERLAAIARVAWGEDTESEALAHRARTRLVEASRHGIQAAVDALSWAEPSRFADILAASIEAERRMDSGDSPYMAVAVERCIWFGSPDAKRLAMDYMTIRPVRFLLLAVIDAAYDHPELKLVVIDTLGLMGDPRARFFLADQLQNGTPLLRQRAAESLATIGGRARDYLRAWSLSEDRELRQIAFRALLPVAGVGDLSTLYEYMTLFPEDDPETLEALRARAALLEDALARQEQLQTETPGIDE